MGFTQTALTLYIWRIRIKIEKFLFFRTLQKSSKFCKSQTSFILFAKDVRKRNFFREFIDTKGYIWLPHANAKCDISLFSFRIRMQNAKFRIYLQDFVTMCIIVYNCVWLCIIVYNFITFCKILYNFGEISNICMRMRMRNFKFCISHSQKLCEISYIIAFRTFQKKFTKFRTSLK